MNRSGPIYEKRRGRLVPVGAIDAEDFDALPDATQFELTPLTHRSSVQLRLYWKALDDVVKATGRWPTRYHLHDALRRDLGYVSLRRNLDGTPYIVEDSTAVDKMPPDEFNAYMDNAMRRLAEVTGIDPLALDRRAA